VLAGCCTPNAGGKENPEDMEGDCAQAGDLFEVLAHDHSLLAAIPKSSSTAQGLTVALWCL